MRAAALLTVMAACGGAARAPDPWRVAPAPVAGESWRLPDGWRTEVIPFPLEFAPSLALTGVEELRFPPGFFDPAAPAYWSYAFAWRLSAPSMLSPPALADGLVAYFRGLTAAVDEDKHRIPDTSAIAAAARGLSAGDVELDVTTYDPFATGALVHLRGRARRADCADGGELWVIGLVNQTAPPAVQADVASLYAEAACGQRPIEATR